MGGNSRASGAVFPASIPSLFPGKFRAFFRGLPSTPPGEWIVMNWWLNLFAREIGFLRGLFPSRGPDRSGRRRPVPNSSTRKTFRPHWKTRLRPLWQPASGFLVSALAHSLLLLWFLGLAARQEPPVVEEPHVLTIHLRKTLERPAEAREEAPEAPTAPAPVEEPSPEPPAPEPLETPPTPARELARPEATLPPSDLEVPRLGSRDLTRPAESGPGARSPGSNSSSEATGRSFQWTRGAGKAASLGTYGGSGATEDAVARSLAWLARHQDRDGKWSADAYRRHCASNHECPNPGRPQYDPGVTALALLAFLGAGHGPDSETPYSENVRRGFRYLLGLQNEQGAIGAGRAHDLYLFYNHALATLALVEAAAIDRDRAYLIPARRALKFSAYYQQTGGGWDYTEKRTGREDLSITGWQVLALKAGESIGIPVPRRVRNRLAHYLDRAVLPDGSAIYANIGDRAGERGVNMAAVGLLSRLSTGISPVDPRNHRAARRVLAHLPDPGQLSRWKQARQSHYYWYTATLALFHYGGDAWRKWNTVLKEVLLPTQVRGGHADGSFSPGRNWVDEFGGRVATTALMALTFEVYYRYPPIHAHRRS